MLNFDKNATFVIFSISFIKYIKNTQWKVDFVNFYWKIGGLLLENLSLIFIKALINPIFAPFLRR